MKSLLLALTLVSALVADPVTAPALAGVPSPSNSIVDPCLVACPAGEVVFHILVRDLANNPVINSVVQIDFCACPGVTLCPQSTTDPYQRVGACQIRKVAGVDGRADFAIRAGGLCANEDVRVFADGVLIAFRRVASPDQDGNLMVNFADLVLAKAKNPGFDRTADFDCDAFVTDADIAWLKPHGGDDCPLPDPTPAIQSTWGSVKVIYR